MKKELFKMKKSLLVMLMAAMALTITACGSEEPEVEAQVEEGYELDPETTGEEVNFIFKVIDPQGEETEMEINTIETTLGAALMAQGYIGGEESEFGLMVNSVLGIYVDYEESGMFWAIYIDGEQAQVGVDGINLEDGRVYEFIAE